jgi:hypothetical protein
MSQFVADSGMRYLTDPPNGHQYGFPKPYDGDLDDLDMNAGLALNSYPKADIDLYACRKTVPARILGLM